MPHIGWVGKREGHYPHDRSPYWAKGNWIQMIHIILGGKVHMVHIVWVGKRQGHYPHARSQYFTKGVGFK